MGWQFKVVEEEKFYGEKLVWVGKKHQPGSIQRRAARAAPAGVNIFARAKV